MIAKNTNLNIALASFGLRMEQDVESHTVVIASRNIIQKKLITLIKMDTVLYVLEKNNGKKTNVDPMRIDVSYGKELYC